MVVCSLPSKALPNAAIGLLVNERFSRRGHEDYREDRGVDDEAWPEIDQAGSYVDGASER